MPHERGLLHLSLDLTSALLVLESLEGVDFDQGSQCVPLVTGFGVLVLLSPKPDSDSLWNVPDSLGPDELVKLDVQPNIVGLHVVSGELLDGLNSLWSLLLELNSLHSLVQDDGVVSGDCCKLLWHCVSI